MLYRHVIDACLAKRGGAGLSRADLAAALSATRPSLERLRAELRDGSRPFLRLPDERDDLGHIAQTAGRFRNLFDDVVILGTGGSSLGGQALYALADLGFGPPPGSPRLHFMDNVDPVTFDALFKAANPQRTGFIAISKSGTTAETLTQLLLALRWLREARGEAALAEAVCIITEPKDSPMSRLAARFGMETLPHDPGVGGRFSVMSLVGLLPAMIAGLDAEAVRHGAGQVLKPVIDRAAPKDIAPAVGAAVSVALSRTAGISQTVLMPYCDRLSVFALWFRQLWAESLGKHGNGTTPIRAVGTVDQHSQVQLYLDGPRDKMFTVVHVASRGRGGKVDAKLAADRELGYIRGRTIGDLMDAEARATAATLIRNGKPVREIFVDRLDEAAMGALMMHYMLETVIAADLLGVDAYDQPAVEEGKVLTRELLAETGRRPAEPKPAAPKPASGKPPARKPAAGKPPARKSVARKSPAKKSPAKKTAGKKPLAKNPGKAPSGPKPRAKGTARTRAAQKRAHRVTPKGPRR